MIKAEKLKTYDPKKFKPGFMSVKRNGVHAIYDPKLGMFYSRTPKEIKGLEHLASTLNSFPFPLVGELTIPGLDFETASGRIRGHGSTPEAHFNIFNTIIPEVKFNKRYERLLLLEEPISCNGCIFIEPMYFVSDRHKFDIFCNEQVQNNREGVCWISPSHIYLPEKRGWDWMKYVPLKSIEATIIDILPGTKGKKYEHSMGRMLCSFRKGSIVYEVRVGIFKGQTDEWRKKIWDGKESYIGETITIEFKDYSKYGIPTQPRFKSFRWDI